MPDDLQAKLTKIIYDNTQNTDVVKVVGLIHKAYKDNGYCKITIGDEKRVFIPGQEWYERFEKELLEWAKNDYKGTVKVVTEIAKRASGIE